MFRPVCRRIPSGIAVGEGAVTNNTFVYNIYVVISPHPSY